ncbi:MAG: alpha/beta fold hydrolase [Bacteroidia bacterium]|nr:alpha/beta fold hydrolase [Bacteroidia bacterium]
MQLLTKTGFITLMVCLIASCSYLPDEYALPSTVTIYEYRDYIEINPTSNQYSKTGLVFYPGGLVDPHAYIAPLSEFAIAGKAHKVVIVKMPGNLAVLDRKQGAWIYDDFPDVQQWVIGGHSLGGAMACSAVDKYPDYFKGLVLMAAYPKGSVNLSQWASPVLSLRGQYDGLVDSLTIASGVGLLPAARWISKIEDYPKGEEPKTVYFTIPGGNHSQFGNYGHQKGDGAATITREAQAELVSSVILKFFIENGLEYDK